MNDIATIQAILSGEILIFVFHSSTTFRWMLRIKPSPNRCMSSLCGSKESGEKKMGKKRKRCTHGFTRFTWVLLFTGYCRVVASSVDNIAMALILNHFYIIYYYDFIQFHWFCVNLNMASSHENGINICHKYMRILLFALNWRFNFIQFECSTEIVCYTF